MVESVTDLEKYKLVAERFRSIVYLWLADDCGCTCGECQELIDAAESILQEKSCPAAPHQ